MKTKRVFDIFAEICKVPRPSKHEEQISQWLQSFAKEHGIDVEKYCAALAQLQTIKRIGACNDGPYDIKLFWGLTDEEIDIFIDKGPIELVKRAFAVNLDQRKRISERVKRESGSVS